MMQTEIERNKRTENENMVLIPILWFQKGTEAVLKGAHHIVNSYRDWLCYYVLFGADGAYTSNG